MKIIKRKFLKYVYPVMRMVWTITNPTTLGVRVLIIDDNQFLAVKHSYRPKYFFPGGKVDKFELIEDAARRELKEEVNIEVGKLKCLGIYRKFDEKKDDTLVLLVTTEVLNRFEIKIDETEIIDYKWSSLNDTSIDLDESNREYLAEYLKDKSKTHYT